jgi:N-methylhydantoinase A
VKEAFHRRHEELYTYSERHNGKSQRTAVYDGGKLGAGAVIKGPAVIEEETTTIVIEPGWTATLDKSGSYVITAVKAARGVATAKARKKVAA